MMSTSGSGVKETLDYEGVASERQNIASLLSSAVAILNKGTEEIERGFGANGDAMTGGASNSVSNKWNNLETEIRNFKLYMENTLNNVGVGSQNTQAIEDQTQQILNSN